MDLTLPPPADPTADDAITDADTTGRRIGRPPGTDGGIAGGVAAHLGRQLGIDPLWFRIAFVLLALAGGIGIVLYAGLWLSLVLAPAMGWDVVGWIGGAIVVVGIPAFLVVSDVGAVDGWLAIVLLLGGMALALWQPRRSLAPVAPRARPALAENEAPAPAVPTPHKPRREPSVLGRATLGLAIVVAAVGALIDDANGGRPHPEQWLGAAALACGAGLLVATWIGRGRWLLLPAIGFAAAGFASGELAAMSIGPGDAIGDDWASVSNGVLASQSAETGLGDVYVQLDQYEGGLDREYRVDARSAFGTVYVSVPTRDVEVEVRARTDHGHTVLDGQAVDDVVTLNAGAGGDGRLVVDAWVGVGDVVVYQSYVADLAPTLGTVPPFDPVGEAVGDGALVQIDQYLAGTADGWIVLAGGEAVLDPDDRVVSGQAYQIGDPSVDAGFAGDGSVSIVTELGEFRLLPRSLLLTPDGRVVDLRAVRESLAATSDATPPASATTDVPNPASTEPQPVVVVTDPPISTTTTNPGGQP